MWQLLLLEGAGGGADCEVLLGGLEAPPKKPLEGAAGLGAGLARRALPPMNGRTSKNLPCCEHKQSKVPDMLTTASSGHDQM